MFHSTVAGADYRSCAGMEKEPDVPFGSKSVSGFYSGDRSRRMIQFWHDKSFNIGIRLMVPLGFMIKARGKRPAAVFNG